MVPQRLAKDEPLQFAPEARHSKSPPHLGASTFQQVDAARIARERQLEADAGVIATSVSVDFLPRKNGCARWKSMLQWTASATLPESRSRTRQSQGCAVPTKRPSLCVFLDILQYPLQRVIYDPPVIVDLRYEAMEGCAGEEKIWKGAGYQVKCIMVKPCGVAKPSPSIYIPASTVREVEF
jgi:hypothetical protein